MGFVVSMNSKGYPRSKINRKSRVQLITLAKYDKHCSVDLNHLSL